jgi:hypothetical protein
MAQYEDEKISQMLNQEIIKVSESSLFFPTFRHIEGGFATDKPLKNFITKRTSNTFSSATAKTLEQTLKEIQTRVDEVKIQKDELLRPFTVLSDTVREIFQLENQIGLPKDKDERNDFKKVLESVIEWFEVEQYRAGKEHQVDFHINQIVKLGETGMSANLILFELLTLNLLCYQAKA